MQMANREYKFETKKLKERVTLNLEKHKGDYEEALADYQTAVRAWVEQLALIAAARTPTLTELHCPVLQPHSHADEYESAIELFSMCAEDVIVINTSEFEMFIMDKWTWRRQFKEAMVSNKQLASNYGRLPGG